MDHLPLPCSPQYPPLEVPFLDFGYLGGDFLDYDIREGVSYEDLYTRSSWSKPPADIASFVQSWLFFGLINTIFQHDYAVEDLTKIERETGHSLLCTERLPAMALAWIQRIRNLSDAEEDRILKLDLHTYTLACLEKAQSVLFRLQVYSPKLLQGEVFVSLLALGEYLAIATITAFKGWEGKPPRLHWAPTLVSDDILSQRLRAQNWCSSQIASIWSTGSVAALYFASYLGTLSDRTHDQCDTLKCLTYQVNEQTYVTKHAQEDCQGCDCRYLYADQKEMLAILRSGASIPLIFFKEDEPFSSRISIVDSSDVACYVAISHVWSDGMGNNMNNSIWQCQLRYLSRAVKSLYPELAGPIPFWFDTICFPLQPKEAYDLGMQKMRASYEKADKVLVIEGGLRGVEKSSLSSTECMVRIGSTGWMRRLWTLQEGILATDLYFQFADEAFSIDEAYEDTFLDTWDSDAQQTWERSSQLSLYVAKMVGEIRMIVPESKAQWISSVARGLAYRSTSVPSDEALCLAVLLELDMGSILAVPENCRMQQVWKLMGSAGAIHPNAPFTSSSKCHAAGFGWAPNSLLDSQNGELYGEGIRGEAPNLTEEGLVLKRIGFILTSVLPIDRSFFFQSEQRGWYKVTIRGYDVDNLLYVSPQLRAHWQSKTERPQLAIICQASEPLPSSAMPTALAILVSIEEVKAEIIYVKYVSKIWIVPADKEQAWGYELADRCKREGKEVALSGVTQHPSDVLRGQLEWDMEHWRGVVGQTSSGSQAWCIM